MRIIEIFKSESEEDRREAVTEILIEYEKNRRKATETYEQQESPKAG